MRVKKWIVTLLVAAAATPAAASSMFDYNVMSMADAHVPMGDMHFNIWIHGKRDTFMIQPGYSTAFSGGGHFPEATWRTVAEAFVSPLGCGISDVKPISRAGATWEATYVCPADIDMHSLAKAQRADLVHGLPLHR